MYIIDININGYGSIKNIELNFKDEIEKQKPIIVVGTSGSGKSLLTSFIIDSLIELQKKNTSNIVDQDFIFKIPKKSLISGNEAISFTRFAIPELKLDFHVEEFVCHEEMALSYIYEKFRAEYQDMKLPVEKRWWLKQTGSRTHIKAEAVTQVTNYLKKICVCCFPNSRYEESSWLNTKLHKKTFQAKYFPYVQSSSIYNREWIYSNLNNDIFLGEITKIFSLVLEVKADQFSISKNNDKLVFQFYNKKLEGLDHFSDGESLIINKFLTIVRYYLKDNIPINFNLSDVTGIVIIDEIENSLHQSFQMTQLPKLVKLFPKVQFFITTHSPSFIIGMQNEFGNDGMRIIEMPDGRTISADEFSEVIYLKQKLALVRRPSIILEGETDVEYFKKALDIFNIDWKDKVDIMEWGGKDNLKKLHTYLNKGKYNDHRVLLIYDHDKGKKQPDKNELVSSYLVEKDPSNNFPGSENLLTEQFLLEITREKFEIFYRNHTLKNTNTGEFIRPTLINPKIGKDSCDLDKMKVCKYYCENFHSIEYYVKFQKIIDQATSFMSSL